MPEFITRMENELKELEERISKLSKFIKSDIFKYYVSCEKQDLMNEQLGVMIHYQRLLKQRLEIEHAEYYEAKRSDNG